FWLSTCSESAARKSLMSSEWTLKVQPSPVTSSRERPVKASQVALTKAYRPSLWLRQIIAGELSTSRRYSSASKEGMPLSLPKISSEARPRNNGRNASNRQKIDQHGGDLQKVIRDGSPSVRPKSGNISGRDRAVGMRL